MEQSYKEKYEHALAKAKEQYNYPCMRSCMGILEEIFPELAESEDERIRKALIEYFNEQCDMSDWNGVYGYQIVSWLEKQKGNICGISPNSAWSEEDEQHIDSLLKRLDALCRNKFERTRFAISEDREWLKSLRPQNRWKPSELQLGCLSDAIEHYNSLGYPAPKLKELLDDLKKLKGKV